MFRTLPVADRVHREDELPEACRHWPRDAICLGWEERVKVRGRRRSDAGLEFGTALSRGTVLRTGDCLLIDPPAVVVRIVERAEPVFVIEPRTPAEWGLFGYHIGNGHQPLMLVDAGFVCPDIPGVEAMLQHCRIPYRRDERPFTPIGGVADHRH